MMCFPLTSSEKERREGEGWPKNSRPSSNFYATFATFNIYNFYLCLSTSEQQKKIFVEILV
jgi:hypothetical protein